MREQACQLLDTVQSSRSKQRRHNAQFAVPSADPAVCERQAHLPVPSEPQAGLGFLLFW